MRRILFLYLFISAAGLSFLQAQELPTTSNSGKVIKAEETSSGFPIFRREETETESQFLKDKPKAIDLRENPNNLMTEADAVKQRWSKDKAAKEEYRNDQSLGNVITNGKFVEVYCRDHEYVDGDRVKIIVNGQVVNENMPLQGGFTPVLVHLQDGFNSIEFVALNQGTSGPNTAELRVLSEKGEQLAKKEWNLLTGAKAQLIVVKN
ncbi:MAG: hypothetical protein ABGW97_01010 [Christiangramia sp.]|uniref:hypothetical protein n=1 Tax=Christiangramia sp. TaxID=1931228 RepID=UPI00324284CA